MPTDKKPIAGQLGVVTKNVVPLRAKADSDSDQVSQALIGQTVVAEAGQGEWLFVQTWDSCRGWIREDSVRIFEDQPRPYASTGPVAIIRELIVDILDGHHERASIITKVTISAEIEVDQADRDWVRLRLPDDRAGYIRKHEARLVDRDMAHTIPLLDPRKLVETALRFVGVPYLWGGTSPFGIDCSGFVQLVHHIHNVTLPRNSSMQAADPRGVPIDRSNLHPGDLVFFGKTKDPNTKGVTHVGMVIGQERFIHSCGSSGVTVAPLDDPYYASIYWGARRLRLETMDPGGGGVED